MSERAVTLERDHRTQLNRTDNREHGANRRRRGRDAGEKAPRRCSTFEEREEAGSCQGGSRNRPPERAASLGAVITVGTRLARSTRPPSRETFTTSPSTESAARCVQPLAQLQNKRARTVPASRDGGLLQARDVRNLWKS